MLMDKNFILLEKAVKKKLLPGLETFPCPFNGKIGIIRIVFPEFTCMCPRHRVSGFREDNPLLSA